MNKDVSNNGNSLKCVNFVKRALIQPTNAPNPNAAKNTPKNFMIAYITNCASKRSPSNSMRRSYSSKAATNTTATASFINASPKTIAFKVTSACNSCK